MTIGRSKHHHSFSGYQVDRSRYTREALAALSPDEYQSLDIWKFVQANLARYTRQAIEVQRKVFSSVDPQEIFHELLVFAADQVMKKHRQHLDAVGMDRAKLLFTVMRNCCSKFAPKIMNGKYNVHIELRVGDMDYNRIFDGPACDDTPARTVTRYAACETDLCQEDMVGALRERQTEEDKEARRIGAQLTLIREHLTGREMQIMTQAILDSDSNTKIAAHCNTSCEVILTTRHRLRRKLKRLAQDQGVELRALMKGLTGSA